MRSQTIQDFEWLVHDSSATASPFLGELPQSDRRVRYFHCSENMTIGAKRNALCFAAASNIIAHFDDDDFYAPRYLEAMLALLNSESADLVKLYGFFLHHVRSSAFGYWNLAHPFPLHAELHPHRVEVAWAPKRVHSFETWAYGFSYVYARKVWEALTFADTSDAEDQAFVEAALPLFKTAGMQDREYLMIHVIHDSNASIAFPQQLLPIAFRRTYFPGYQPPALSKELASSS